MTSYLYRMSKFNIDVNAFPPTLTGMAPLGITTKQITVKDGKQDFRDLNSGISTEQIFPLNLSQAQSLSTHLS